ncbi:MAG: chorismate synthase, partial [Clostridia bacterium]|nr:chorismate synthase [Clostridia bacterium]
IEICAHISSIKDISDIPFERTDIRSAKDRFFPLLDETKKTAMLDVIADAKANSDSVGGTIECAVTGLPIGLGNPMFDGLENKISQIIFGIPAIKGIEFGNGFDATKLLGSENNDPFVLKDEAITTETNNHGGILGGISSGMPLTFKVAVKPTPSIGLPQKSVNLTTCEPENLIIKGRHDPCIVPRAVPCVEAATAIAVLDALLD